MKSLRYICPNEQQRTCPNGKRRTIEVIENIGAGEGNRTLVFSLEGSRRLNTFNPYSDQSSQNALFNANGLFVRSECRAERDDLIRELQSLIGRLQTATA
jgi:hypothetical protein